MYQPYSMHRQLSILLEATMSRVQLALNVSDVEEAVEFYSKLFGTEPAKRRPGYANFAIAEPPLKLVLLEDLTARGHGTIGALNHLGVEVETTDEVSDATARLRDAGMTADVEEQTTCCYAVQDKVWVSDPDGAPWEVYTVLADAPAESGVAGDGSCCVAEAGGSVTVTEGAAVAPTAPAGSPCC
jgi:catechol 2,3-dioxygenase-like lactoylglutathione lyase family enzyme